MAQRGPHNPLNEHEILCGARPSWAAFMAPDLKAVKSRAQMQDPFSHVLEGRELRDCVLRLAKDVRGVLEAVLRQLAVVHEAIGVHCLPLLDVLVGERPRRQFREIVHHLETSPAQGHALACPPPLNRPEGYLTARRIAPPASTVAISPGEWRRMSRSIGAIFCTGP